MTEYPADTIFDLLARGTDAAPAIGAPGRPALTYADLRALARRTVQALNAVGIGRNDRVAIVMPNGPEMAASFVAVGSGATTAPLNPAYKQDELDFYLSDLKASALLIARGMESPARSVAADAGHPGDRHRAGRGCGRLHARRRRPAGRTGGTAGHGGGGRYRAGAAHVGHDLAPEDRAADTGQRHRVAPTISRRRWR